MQSLNSSGMNDASYKRKGEEGDKLQVLCLENTRKAPERSLNCKYLFSDKKVEGAPVTVT